MAEQDHRDIAAPHDQALTISAQKKLGLDQLGHVCRPFEIQIDAAGLRRSQLARERGLSDPPRAEKRHGRNAPKRSPDFLFRQASEHPCISNSSYKKCKDLDWDAARRSGYMLRRYCPPTSNSASMI